MKKWLKLSTLYIFIIFLFNSINFALGQKGTTDNVESVWDIGYLSLAISAVLGIFVLILLVYFGYKYREGSLVKRKKMSHKAERNLEIIWISLSILLVIFATGVTIAVTSDVRANQTVENVDATYYIEGHQFSFSFYTNASKDSASLITGNLVLEVGKKYQLVISSRDVIHSFFVYDLGIKQDAIPGKEISIFIEPKITGMFEVRCAQFCGSGHYTMQGVQFIEVI